MSLSTQIQWYVDQNLLTLNQANALNPNEVANLESNTIRGLIVDEILTIAQAIELDVQQVEALGSESIRNLMDEGIITLEQLLTLNPDELLVLRHESTQQRLRNAELTVENITEIIPVHYEDTEPEEWNDEPHYGHAQPILPMNYENNQPHYGDAQAILPLDQEDNQPYYEHAQPILPYHGPILAHHVLQAERRGIEWYVEQNLLTQNQANALTRNERSNLLSENIKSLIIAGILSVEQALVLNDSNRYNLDHHQIPELVIDGFLTLEQALHLGPSGEILYFIRDFIVDGTLSLEEALSLGFYQVRNLASRLIQNYITEGKLTFGRALSLTENERLNLELEDLSIGMVTQGTLTIEQAMALSQHQRTSVLGSVRIREMIRDGIITVEEALALNPLDTYQHTFPNNLESAIVRDLIANRVLPLAQAARLCAGHVEALELESIRNLIEEEIITFEELLVLRPNELLALRDEDTQQRLRNGQITIENIRGVPVYYYERGVPVYHYEYAPLNNAQLILPMNYDNAPYNHYEHAAPIMPVPVQYYHGHGNTMVINDPQSTHTASIHRTVSESATRLFNRYSTQLQASNLDAIIGLIRIWVEKLPNDDIINISAKRCVMRLTQPQYVYMDSGSKLNTKQLLALFWLAIHDETLRQGSLEDAERQLCEALYEIQRGYNLSDKNVDNLNNVDLEICSGGTFNKLIEKLTGIHPDVSIEFLNETTAGFKLAVVVKEELIAYLKTNLRPKTANELINITKQLKEITHHGQGIPEVIWKFIKNKVEKRMFNEFASFYINKEDERFTALIESGQYVQVLPPSFQKELSESEGYHQYCSIAMKSYSLFSKMSKNKKDEPVQETKKDAKKNSF